MFKRFFGEVKKLNLSEKLLLALVFVLPFERIPSFELGGFTIKLSLLVGIVLMTVVAWQNLRLGGSRNRLSLPLLMPGLLLIYSLATIIWVGDKGDWLRVNLVLGFMVMLFYGCCRVVSESKYKERLTELIAISVLFSAGVVMAFGFFQWFGDLLGLGKNLTGIRPEYTADKLGLTRMHSVLLEPLYFGLYLLLPLGILWADRTGRVVKNFYSRFSFIALIYLSILISLARGAIVASVVVGVIGLIYNFEELRKKLKAKDLARIGLISVVLLGMLIVSTSLLGKKGTDEDHSYQKGFSTIVGHLETIKPWGNKEDAKDQNSISSRDEARSKAWNVLTDNKTNFLFGVGAGQYGERYSETSNFVLLDVWVEYGLIGLLLVIAFFASIFMVVLKTKEVLLKTVQVLVIGFTLYLIGFVVQSITFGELGVTHLWVMSAICLGLIKDSTPSSA